MSESEAILRRLRDFLHRSAADEEPLVVAYAGGSRPGHARAITIVEILVNWPGFTAREDGNPALKTYSLKQILWAENSSGARIENTARMLSFAEFERFRKETANELRALVHGTTPSNSYRITPSAGTVPSRFAIGLDGAHRAVIQTTDLASTQRACAALDYVRNRSLGRVWDVLGVLIHCGFVWPAWCDYHQALVKEGHALRGMRRRLRDQPHVYNERGNTKSTAADKHLDIYDFSVLRPIAEEDYETRPFFARVRLYESSDLNIPDLLNRLAQLHPETLSKFLTAASAAVPFNELPSDELSDVDVERLKSAQFIVPASLAPLNLLLRYIKPSELYACIKARGAKLPAYDPQSYREYCHRNMDSAFERAIRSSDWLGVRYFFNPTKDWETFQDFRTCYSEMIRAIVRWTSGDWVGAGERLFFKCEVAT